MCVLSLQGLGVSLGASLGSDSGGVGADDSPDRDTARRVHGALGVLKGAIRDYRLLCCQVRALGASERHVRPSDSRRGGGSEARRC